MQCTHVSPLLQNSNVLHVGCIDVSAWLQKSRNKVLTTINPTVHQNDELVSFHCMQVWCRRLLLWRYWASLVPSLSLSLFSWPSRKCCQLCLAHSSDHDRPRGDFARMCCRNVTAALSISNVVVNLCMTKLSASACAGHDHAPLQYTCNKSWKEMVYSCVCMCVCRCRLLLLRM